ncbi:alpha-1-acid glycoprotein [Lepus europaeus]|uniref:alpha-1-acid glycoprotein n=1 Tax=Lepus europaeus TaxID=9983 RepID=UPI002B499AE6|nr:alpha-1-acid glycoprotein [Lepus europaeus]
MALPWALAVLSLLPLLHAQDPACANFTISPITNATLDWLSHKWFFTASAFRNPKNKQLVQHTQAAFFYFTAIKEEDTLLLREYITTNNTCFYNSSIVRVQRENGTLSKHDGIRNSVADLLLLRDPGSFLLTFFAGNEQEQGMSFYTDKPKASPEQLEEFYKALTCLGMNKTEVIYTDWTKDLCEPLEKQHEEERKKEKAES